MRDEANERVVEALASWLRAKYARHRELEDLKAAELIERFQQREREAFRLANAATYFVTAERSLHKELLAFMDGQISKPEDYSGFEPAHEPDGYIRYSSWNPSGDDPEQVFTYEFASREEPHEGEGWVPLYARASDAPTEPTCLLAAARAVVQAVERTHDPQGWFEALALLKSEVGRRPSPPPEVIPDRLQEAGWLVERGNIIPEYAFFDKTGCFGWTSDANAAMRFARRVDANMFAAANDEAWRIVEHMWVKYDEQPTSTKCERQNTGGDAGSQARWDQGGGAGDSSFGETRPAELCSKCHSSRPCACQLAGGHFSTALGERA